MEIIRCISFESSMNIEKNAWATVSVVEKTRSASLSLTDHCNIEPCVQCAVSIFLEVRTKSSVLSSNYINIFI